MLAGLFSTFHSATVRRQLGASSPTHRFDQLCLRRRTHSLARSQTQTWSQHARIPQPLAEAAANCTPISTRQAKRSICRKSQKRSRGSRRRIKSRRLDSYPGSIDKLSLRQRDIDVPPEMTETKYENTSNCRGA